MQPRNHKHTSTPHKKTRDTIPQDNDTFPRSCVQQPATGVSSLATKTPKSRTAHELRQDKSRNKRRRFTPPRGDALPPSLATTGNLFWTYPDTPCPIKRKQRKHKPAIMRQTTPIIITDESDIEDNGDHTRQDGSTDEEKDEDEETGHKKLQDKVMGEEEFDDEGVEASEDNGDDDGDDDEDDDESEDNDDDDDDEEVTFVRENVISPVSTRRQYADKHPPPPSPSPPQASAADAGTNAPMTNTAIDLCGFVNRLMQKPEVWPHIIDIMRETGILSNVAQQVTANGLTGHRPPSHEENTQTRPQSQVDPSAAQQEQPALITPTTDNFNSLRATSSSLSQAETLRPSPVLSSPGSESRSINSELTTFADEFETSTPPTIWSALEQDMIQHPPTDHMEWFWRMGTQYGIGAGIAAFRQALNETPDVVAQRSGTMPATEDVSVAARAARDVLWARQRVVDAIVKGGAAQHVRESGGFIRADSLLESQSGANKEAGGGAGAGAVGSDVFVMVDNEEPVSYTAGGDLVGGVDMSRLNGNAGLAARMLLEDEMNVDVA